VLPATDIIGAQGAVFDKYKSSEIKYEVTREQLDRVPYSRIGDIFNGVPGVSSADGSNGAGLQINIRGLSGMSRVKTLVDGSMQTSNVHRGYPGDKDQTYIDPDLIGGIDIKKGPDAGPQGAGVVGGIVNMRSINATDIITDPDKNWGIRIKGMYGNNVATGDMYRETYKLHGGYYWDGTRNVLAPKVWSQDNTFYFNRKSGRGEIVQCRHPLNGGCDNPIRRRGITMSGRLPERNISGSLAAAFRPWDNLELTIAYAERESGNYYSGKRVRGSSLKPLDLTRGMDGVPRLTRYNGREVMNSSQRSDSYLAKGKLYFWDDHSLEFSHIKYRTQYGYQRNRQSVRYWQDRLKNSETATYTLNYAWQPDNPWLDVRSNLWKSRLNSDSLSLEMADYSILHPKDSEILTDSFGGELWNTSLFNMPLGGELSLKYGLSFSHERPQGYVMSSDPFGSGSKPPDPTEMGSTVNGSRRIYGAFMHNNWQITHWLAANAGLQYTQGKLEDHATALCIRGRPCAFSRLPPNRQRALDPSYGFIIEPHQAVQLFAQWSHGSRMPTIRESLMVNAAATAPNPDLKMEKAQNFEYGVNLLFNSLLVSGDSLGIKFSKFDNKYKDYITTLSRALLGEGGSPYPPPYQGKSSKFTNIKMARFQGYELSADYDSGWLFGSFSLTHFDKVEYCYPIRTRRGRPYFDYIYTPTTCYDDRPITAGVAETNDLPPRQEKNASMGVRLFDQKLILGGAMKMSSKSMISTTRSSLYKSGVYWDNYEVYDIYGQLKLSKNLELGFSVENIGDRFYIPSYSTMPEESQPAPGRTARGMFTFRF